MSGLIIHCPNCGDALATNPRVHEATVVNTPHNKFVRVQFMGEEIAHTCAKEI